MEDHSQGSDPVVPKGPASSGRTVHTSASPGLAGLTGGVCPTGDPTPRRLLIVEEAEERLPPALRAGQLAEQARLLDLTEDSFIVRLTNGEILHWSRGAEAVYGYTRDEALGHKAHELLQTRTAFGQAGVERLLHRQGHWEGDLWQTARSGAPLVVSSRWVLRRNRRNEPVDVFEIGRNITRRSQLEEQTRRQREQLRAVLNMIPGYVAIKDQHCRLRFVNRGFIQAFSEPADRPCHAVQFQRESRCRKCLAHKVLQTGIPNSAEITFPNGRTFHVWAHPFTDVDGRETVLEVGVDNTARRKAERVIGELAETHRRAIGRELHDSLGQKLTGLGYLLEALRHRRDDAAPEERNLLAQLQELVASSISEVRALSRGLDPVGLNEQGLAGSLRQLVSETLQGGALRCKLRLEEIALDDDPAVHLYRIAQEALSNIVRHAQAENVIIELARRGQELLLRVRDDGVGIPWNVLHGERSEGMGLRSMHWRATCLDADLDLRRPPEGGTELLCRTPLKRNRDA